MSYLSFLKVFFCQVIIGINILGPESIHRVVFEKGSGLLYGLTISISPPTPSLIMLDGVAGLKLSCRYSTT